MFYYWFSHFRIKVLKRQYSFPVCWKHFVCKPFEVEVSGLMRGSVNQSDTGSGVIGHSGCFLTLIYRVNIKGGHGDSIGTACSGVFHSLLKLKLIS